MKQKARKKACDKANYNNTVAIRPSVIGALVYTMMWICSDKIYVK